MNESSSYKADLILIKGNIITLDPLIPKAAWLSIKNSIIIGIGDGEDWKDYYNRDSKIIDCGEKTILPGFIDAHLHLMSYAESLMTLDLFFNNRPHTISDIKSMIHNYSRDLSPGIWIFGKGYNEFYLDEKRHPNRWDLDEAATHHPIKLTHRSGHAHVLNSLGLKLVGISKTTPDPKGGIIERDLKTGEPTGLLYEMGRFLSEHIPPLSDRELEQGIMKASDKLVACGITSVHDASYGNDIARYRRIESFKKRGLFIPRLRMMIGMKSLDEYLGQDFSGYSNKNQLRIDGVKIILDETTGSLIPSKSELNEMVLKIHRGGMQVSIHAIEENAIEAACESIAFALNKIPKRDHRHRIEHCSVCPPWLAKKISSLEIVVVSQPSFLCFSGDRYLKTVSNHLLKHLYPFRSLLNEGIMLAASSDCPIAPPDPLIGISTAVARKAQTGDIVVPEECISVMDALELYTKNAAFVSFEENAKGTVSPGKLADLVILNTDPTLLPRDEIKDIEVEMTIIDGKVVWDKTGWQRS